MKTKNMFKALAMAMLMPAMLLTTACSNDDFAVNNDNTEIVNQKGFTIPVTINVTRQGDDATMRATFDNDTKKLSFSTGDKLFVKGYESVAGSFAGTLTWVSEGTFTGTITTEKEYTGTYEQLFTAAKSTGHATATLLPNGYESVNFLYIQDQGTVAKYDDEVFANYKNAFALTKAAGVEQLSWEWGDYSIGTGFALSSGNTILNFTITGLAASTNVNVSLELEKYSVNKSVTTNASGTASFAIGVYGGAYNLNELALTVGGNSIARGSKELAAGHIYNISRSVGGLSGKFTINSSGDKVFFSKGNLRYASGTWSFFDNQYDYYTSYSADAWDKFGWSTSANTYGMYTSTIPSDYSGDFVDWGSNSDLQTALGTGWFTLSSAEWTYLFNTRSASTVGGTENGRYAKAKVNDVQGIILFPDTYTHPGGVTAPVGVNATGDTGWNGNNYSSADWTKMESAGCVFLPAAGYRNGSSVYEAGTVGIYRSATLNGSDCAYNVDFNSGDLNPTANGYARGLGFSVRLVRKVE
jgi:hypothetical protein